MERKITHKVGVKILTKQQLENIMPTYENLFQKIDTCREAAKKELSADDKTQKGHYQYNFMYDNVFSILGRRGTGKTSVAFTLREEIINRYEEHLDEVLPLIIPEVIPEDCTILGWILAIVKESIADLEDKIAKLDKVYDEQFWEKCKYIETRSKENSLERKLDELSQLFYAKGYNSDGETSYYRAIDNSAKQAEDYYKFAAKIAEFWDAWVERIRRLYTLKKGEDASTDNCCPLIYFIFDDVDLAPEKIEELLSVIIKYLSHPNIIVITTADEELFLEVLENRLDRKIGRYQRDLRNYLIGHQESRNTLWRTFDEKERVVPKDDMISQTARMYLGKVLPTSTRYYLRLFNSAREKEAFYVEGSRSLGEGVRDQIQSLIGDETNGEIINFMKTDDKIINFYLKFMGNTSRQIGNVYIALQDLISNLTDIMNQCGDETDNREKNLRQIYQNCRYFMCIAVNANHTLSDRVGHIDAFVDELFLYEYNQWKMYCDYSFLSNFLTEKLENETAAIKVTIGLQLFSLLAFIENILLILEKGMPGGIDRRVKTHEVLPLTEYISDVAFGSRAVFRDDLSAHEFFEHYVDLLNRLETIVEDRLPEIKFNMEYFSNFRNYYRRCTLDDVKRMYTDNRKWFREIAGMLSMVYGNVYLFDEKNMEECLIYPNRIYLIRYQKRIDTEIKNNIKHCFMCVYMQSEWKLSREQYEELKLPANTEASGFYDFVELINRELWEQEEKTVFLRQVLDAVFQKLEKEPYRIGEQIKKYSPVEIQEDLQKNWKGILQDRHMTRNLLIKYMEMVRNKPVGNELLLQDISNVINVLKECAKQFVSFASSINEILLGLASGMQEKEDKFNMIMSRGAGAELITTLTNIHKHILESAKRNNYMDEETMLLKTSIEELFGSMDVIIDLTEHPSQGMLDAVKLGILITFLKILQGLYIFQLIHEGYENGNGMSSRELEYVEINGERKETYYYQLFMEMTNLVDGNIEDEDDDAPIVGVRDLGADIRTTCASARERYVETLIERIENE